MATTLTILKGVEEEVRRKDPFPRLQIVEFPLELEVFHDWNLLRSLQGYYWENGILTSDGFRTKRVGRSVLQPYAVHFNGDIGLERRLNHIDDLGFRNMEIREALAFGNKYPSAQLKGQYVAYGSCCQIGHRYYMPRLDRNVGRRYVWVSEYTSHVNTKAGHLVVKK